MKLRFLFLILFAFYAAPVYAAQPDEMLKDPALEARAKAIGEELRCLVCQNESIEDSAAPLAHDLRVLLRQRLTAGDSDEAAKQYIVARYGDYVLLKPPLTTSTLALWFGPLALLFAALACAVGYFRNRENAPDEDIKDHETHSGKHDRRATQRIVLITVPILLLAAGLLYAYLGAPELPDRPYAARRNDPDFRLNAAAETIAVELETHPDARAYIRLSGMFYALHRYDRAAECAQKAVALAPKDASAWSLLGENIVMQNNGAVVMEALGDFKTALKYDHTNPRARFYVGLAETEIGNFKKAVAIWRDLENSAPPDAPWLDMVKRNIALYSKEGGFDAASVTPTPVDLKNLR